MATALEREQLLKKADDHISLSTRWTMGEFPDPTSGVGTKMDMANWHATMAVVYLLKANS